jgi:hypothetical protein
VKNTVPQGMKLKTGEVGYWVPAAQHVMPLQQLVQYDSVEEPAQAEPDEIPADTGNRGPALTCSIDDEGQALRLCSKSARSGFKLWKDIASEGFDELSLIAPDLVQVQFLKAEFDERRKPIHMLVKVGGNQNGPMQILWPDEPGNSFEVFRRVRSPSAQLPTNSAVFSVTAAPNSNGNRFGSE